MGRSPIDGSLDQSQILNTTDMAEVRVAQIRRRVLSVALLVIDVAVAWPVAQPAVPRLPLLSHQPQSRSESLLADLLAEGTEATSGTVAPDGRVGVVVAARRGAERELESHAASVGASIVFKDDAVGYFELLVPPKSLLAFSSHSSVEAFDIDGQNTDVLTRGDLACPQESPLPSTLRHRADPVPLNRETARVLRETGFAALGIDALLRENPTFDGRGVTIAMIDGLTTGLPIFHPAFRTATDLSGAPVPKIRDMVIVNPGWRSATATTRTGGGDPSAATAGRPRTLPYDAEFRAGTVETPWQTYEFVWDTAARTVWVDANRNGDFRDDPPMRDARAFPEDIGEFPAAKSPLGVFRVTTDPETSRVVFHMVSPTTSSNHAAKDAAVAAGSDEFIRGVAPGASLVLLDPSNNRFVRISDMVRTLIYAARRPDVDIISMSFAVSASPVPADDIVNVISDRLVRQFHKILITAASNPTWRDVPDAVGTYSVSVGAYMPGAAARHLGETTDRREHWILPYSARGPRGNGDARPDVVAPAVWMSLGRCEVPGALRRACPELSGGTSAAAPALAGAVALLVSGAKQRGTQLAGEDIRMLLRASAAYVPGWRADEQGAGVANMAAAWKLLTTQRDWPTIVGSSSLDEARRGFLSNKGWGRGVYEKSWIVGHSGQVPGKFTRVSGVAGTQSFDLDWTGNDGTFKAPRMIDLTLNAEAVINVEIMPRTSGFHSALLNFRDRATGHLLHQEQVTVIAASRADLRPIEGILPAMGRLGQMVPVPAGTTALRMRLKTDGAINVAATSPSSWPQSPLSLVLDAGREGGADLIVPQPAAGTWEVSALSDANANGAAPIAYSMAVSVLGMSFRDVKRERSGTWIAQIELRDDPHGSWPRDVRGRLGFITHTVRGEVSAVRQDVREVTVAPDLRSVVFRATVQESGRGDLTLYVYDCSSTPCRRADVSRTSSGKAALRFETPRAGLWKVIVLSAGAEPLPYRIDVIAEPIQTDTLGRVDCQKEDVDLVRCTTWLSPSAKDGAIAALFDVDTVDGTLGRASCRLAHNRPVPVGLVADLSSSPSSTAGSGR